MVNFDDKVNELLTEMARADLKGAEEALKTKDWTTAANKYIENARARDLDDKKIIAGLGATFRKKADSETVEVAKGIEMPAEDVTEFKKAVKDALGWKPAPKKKSSKKAKEGEESEEDKEEKDVVAQSKAQFAEARRKAILKKVGAKVEEGKLSYRNLIVEANEKNLKEAKHLKKGDADYSPSLDAPETMKAEQFLGSPAFEKMVANALSKVTGCKVADVEAKFDSSDEEKDGVSLGYNLYVRLVFDIKKDQQAGTNVEEGKLSYRSLIVEASGLKKNEKNLKEAANNSSQFDVVNAPEVLKVEKFLESMAFSKIMKNGIEKATGCKILKADLFANEDDYEEKPNGAEMNGTFSIRLVFKK